MHQRRRDVNADQGIDEELPGKVHRDRGLRQAGILRQQRRDPDKPEKTDLMAGESRVQITAQRHGEEHYV